MALPTTIITSNHLKEYIDQILQLLQTIKTDKDEQVANSITELKHEIIKSLEKAEEISKEANQLSQEANKIAIGANTRSTTAQGIAIICAIASSPALLVWLIWSFKWFCSVVLQQ
jgi:methyl-accepting chemotaxis protein